jgi:protoporphyrinogen/coproporphyrinogen III oxidase
MADSKVIIIGAGLGGLSAGYWLRQRGCEVEVLEASARPGGRTIVMEHRGDQVDVGAQFYHSNFRYAFELLDAVNLTSTQRFFSGKIKLGFADGSTNTYDPQVPYMKPLGLWGNLRMYAFFLRHILFAGRAGKYLITEDIPEYDNLEALEAFTSRFDGPMRDTFVAMSTKAVGLVVPEFISFYHFVNMFSHVSLAKYISLTGGIASLARELARRLPVRYEAPVRRLVMEKGRVVGVQMEGDGSIRKAGHVIVAATPDAAAPLMPEELEEQRRFLESVQYVQYPMPIFFLDRPLDRSIWCYFNDPRLKLTYAYAIDQLVKAPEMIRSGKSVLVGFGIHPMALDLLDQPDEVVLKKAQEDYELSVPGLSSLVEDARVYRHKFVNAIYPPGAYRSVLDFVEGAKKLRGVSFVSSVLGGECMEAALSSSREAVKRVCGWGGLPPG